MARLQVNKGLEGKRLAIRGRRIRDLLLEGKWRMEMGMGMDRCGQSRGMAGEVESADRGGWEVGKENCEGLFRWVCLEYI